MDKAKENARTALNRKKLKDRGICCKCWKEKVDGDTVSCKICKDKYKIRKDNAVNSGLCSRCLKEPLFSEKACRGCLNKQKLIREDLKDRVYSQYGGYKCACCGELEKAFLTIDHVENNGNILRKEQGSGNPFYRWLIRNNFPIGYQILCMNCQFGKARSEFGICPHQLTNNETETFAGLLGCK